MYLVGNGWQAVEQMQHLISEYLIQSYKVKNLIEDGNYVRKWVTELKNVPNKFIHKPWELNDEN